jgi:hypothetical protein
MNRLFGSTVLLALVNLSAPAFAETLHGTLYKDPNCPCCEGHAAYLREHGVDLVIEPVENHSKISEDAGIPSYYEGCHTILLNGYAIAGHVSIAVVQKLLRERPADVVAISLPGMPVGVPGMEGEKTEPYEVFAIKKDGSASVFAIE